MFDKWVGDRFQDLPGGRAIFFPKGRDGTVASLALAQLITTRGAPWYWVGSLILLASFRTAIDQNGD